MRSDIYKERLFFYLLVKNFQPVSNSRIREFSIGFFQEPFSIDFKAIPVWIRISGSVAENSVK